MSNTLMISVSGMRGIVGADLTPELVARHAAALGAWAKAAGAPRVVLGRDARTSGEMFSHAATAGLLSVGVEAIDVGVAPTPTVQMAVEYHHAGAGLILTASHNPIEWNALKFVGPDGIFLDGEAGAAVRELAERGPARQGWDGIGSVRRDAEAFARHLEAILALPLVDVERIRARRFRVALDTVRGAGGTSMPRLLDRLGCSVAGIHLDADGRFPREPEPVPANLGELGELVRTTGAAIGFAVDPDVDRLAIVDERGEPIGEDYTLALAVHAVLSQRGAEEPPATVVANLSTSRVVEDAAATYGARFLRAPVGEANVARTIVETGAVIGGEGNGGVILPALHVGRDAPLGVALILHYLAGSELALSHIVRGAPQYRIVKDKVPRGADLAEVYTALRRRFADGEADDRDGLRLAWSDRWLHVRPSGTEPIIRLIAEAPTEAAARELIAAGRMVMV